MYIWGKWLTNPMDFLQCNKYPVNECTSAANLFCCNFVAQSFEKSGVELSRVLHLSTNPVAQHSLTKQGGTWMDLL